MSDLREMGARMLIIADGIMRSNGFLNIAIIGVCRDGREMLMLPHIEDSEQRQQLLKLAFVAYDVVAYGAATEAWMLMTSLDDPTPLLRPSQSDRRTEVIICVACNGRQSATAICDIDRNDEGGYAGMRPRPLNEATSGSGRLVELLPVPRLPRAERKRLQSRLVQLEDVLRISEMP